MPEDITNQQLLDKIDISHQQLLDAMTQQLGVITDNMVTKQDLKEELKVFATKDDLNNLEVKMATKSDLNRMTVRLERKIVSNQAANIQHHLETRKAIGGLTRQVGNLREGLAQAASSR